MANSRLVRIGTDNGMQWRSPVTIMNSQITMHVENTARGLDNGHCYNFVSPVLVTMTCGPRVFVKQWSTIVYTMPCYLVQLAHSVNSTATVAVWLKAQDKESSPRQ
eukprot:4101334-Amphidinium_carterae.1